MDGYEPYLTVLLYETVGGLDLFVKEGQLARLLAWCYSPPSIKAKNLAISNPIVPISSYRLVGKTVC